MNEKFSGEILVVYVMLFCCAETKMSPDDGAASEIQRLAECSFADQWSLLLGPG